MIKEFEEKISKNDVDEENNDKLETQNNEEIFNVINYLYSIRPTIIFYSSFEDSLLPKKISYTDIPNNQAVKDFETVYNVNFQSLLDTNITNDQIRENEEDRINAEAAASLNDYRKQTIS
jgi:hypothetical protein